MGLIVKKSPFFKKTAKKYLQKNAKLRTSYLSFEKFKNNDPNALFGGPHRDKPSPSGTLYANKFPKMRHAHLLGGDHSIWYSIVGNELRLYGILTHQDSGTAPTSAQKQKQVVQKFSNQIFEQNGIYHFLRDI